MRPDIKRDVLKRLSYVEGHLAGVRKMVEDEKYCVDILKQTYAVRRAIEKIEALLLDGHLHTCVVEGIREGRTDEVTSELLELYGLAPRRLPDEALPEPAISMGGGANGDSGPSRTD
jgi:DNA-binding FrmR family transcriptional regulator